MTPSLTNTYNRPKVLFNRHLETIYPALFRKVKLSITPIRERIQTPDNDFLDIDWYKNKNGKVVILQHGLEGSSNRPYILGMAKIFIENDFDVCAWNFRGCSGEMNKTKIFYHSGATYDLDTIVKRVSKEYDEIILIGFSLGGNLTLKYLGEETRSNKIKRAIAISVPLDLNSSSWQLTKPNCYIYEKRFLNNLKRKVLEKSNNSAHNMNISLINKVKTLRDFDEYFTSQIHGFDGAEDYYHKCSAKYFLSNIQVPTLIISAQNDPLLTKESLKIDTKMAHSFVDFELTEKGGHVGFTEFNSDGYFWSEKRALNFCLK